MGYPWKITALFLSICTAAALGSAIPSHSSAQSHIMTGDVNGNGLIDAADLQQLQQFLLNGSAIAGWEAGDLDANQKLNGMDLCLLRQKVLKECDYTALRINEICAANKNSFQDASGASPDWIEIINTSDQTLSLAGIGLSDGKKIRSNFPFRKMPSLRQTVMSLCCVTTPTGKQKRNIMHLSKSMPPVKRSH